MFYCDQPFNFNPVWLFGPNQTFTNCSLLNQLIAKLLGRGGGGGGGGGGAGGGGVPSTGTCRWTGYGFWPLCLKQEFFNRL